MVAGTVNGGGVYCDSRAGVVSNCALVKCSGYYGGGVYGGRAGLLGGCWLWDADRVSIDPKQGLPQSLSGEFYASSTPLYGRFDPSSKELDPEKLHPWSDYADALQYACLHHDNGATFGGAKPLSTRREVKPAPMRWAIA